MAQYPVLRTAQSALHFTSRTDLFTQTPFRLRWEASSHMLQLMREGQVLIFFSWVNWSNVEWKNLPRFKHRSQDPNPGSRSREFEALPLSHCARSICTNNIILRRRHLFLLQRRRLYFRESNPLHDSDGKLQCSNTKSTNPVERATDKVGHGLWNERADTLVERAISRTYTIMNTMLQKTAGRGWTWTSRNGVTKIEIDYILTNRPDIVTDVTVINQVKSTLEVKRHQR